MPDLQPLPIGEDHWGRDLPDAVVQPLLGDDHIFIFEIKKILPWAVRHLHVSIWYLVWRCLELGSMAERHSEMERASNRKEVDELGRNDHG